MSDKSWSRVANYLPTGTSLAFQALVNSIVSPSGATCHAAEQSMAGIALAALGSVCVFSAFTDTVTYKGKNYYLLIRKNRDAVPFFLNGYPEDYSGSGPLPADLQQALWHISPLDWHDILHAILSLLVFLTLALLNDPVRSCFFGNAVPEAIVRAVPVIVTLFVSAFFSKFLKDPRRSIGFNVSGGAAPAVMSRKTSDDSRLSALKESRHNLL
jgi:hypothetical protein